MAEMWYYTCEGKQMEPVTTAELKKLAASGYRFQTLVGEIVRSLPFQSRRGEAAAK